MAASLESAWTEFSHRTNSRGHGRILSQSAASVLRFANDDGGQDLIEYALLLGFIGLALFGSGIHFASARNVTKDQAGIAGS